MKKPTLERLKAELNYNPETGVFTRKTANKRNAAGAVVGSKNGRGYTQICVDGYPYTAHRLAWLYMTGEWPTGDIDHINRDQGDNRFANFRAVTRSENKLNQNRQRNNTSGYQGVFDVAGRWKSTITLHNRVLWLGTYDTYAEALAARKGAEKVLGVPQQSA